MIVREEDGGGFVVFEQHEHALVSGELVRRWTPPPVPFASTVFAVSNHDLAWRELDAEVAWDGERGRPVSFTEYPSEPKVRAYAAGIDRVEERDPYAACLCSMHYATVVAGSSVEVERRFASREVERQGRLTRGFSAEEKENLQRNLRLLKVCDGLSLFVCLNEPGRTARLFPPYEAGFEVDGRTYEPGWAGEDTLELLPGPFSEDFEVRVPYALLDAAGREAGRAQVELKVRNRRVERDEESS